MAILLGGATPAPGPLHIIGGPRTGGCIAGAQQLPDHGPGFMTIHRNRSSFWGAPQTIAHLELLGHLAAKAGLPDLLIEDISLPRGGPMAGGHVSHQIGLDADVGLDLDAPRPASVGARETVVLASLVRADRRDIEPERWSPQVITLLHIAASLPDVDRVLVNPAIKARLCRDVTGDRSWLHLIRPWYGHAAHMHVSFKCPVGQADCIPAPPPPSGDGCDATLQWWFDQLNVPAKPGPPPKPRPVPAACKAIFAAAAPNPAH
ncbi:MAG TPA: penicillin-insensitive murein endopeptidase [Acetobacteraceae bacterium]|nr:penicillin-insensitive murein endopeptidase [Acetobacteraceae bacterium]